MNESVSPEQRFTSAHPCWICGGGKDYPSGSGQRCHGYESKDKQWAWCSREDYAHGVPANELGLYRHHAGKCSQGVEHDNGAEGNGEHTAETPRRGRGRPRKDNRVPIDEKTWPLTETYGKVIGYKKRLDFGPKDKEFVLLNANGEEGNLGVKPQFFPFYPVHQLNGHQEIVACEGEKTADAINDALKAAGLEHKILAVGWTGGSMVLPAERPLSAFYKCDTVTVWPDNDPSGIDLGKHIGRSLTKKGIPHIKRVKTDDLPEKADAADLPDEEILARIEAAEDWTLEDQLNIKIVHLEDVKSEAVEWLWTGYIPFGGITLLDGNPGEGKTGIALDFVRRVANGLPFPKETALIDFKPMKALIITAEDSIEKSIKPRLDDYQADISRIRILQFTEEKGGERVFDFTKDLEQLKDALDADPEIRLIIIDPIQMHIGVATDMNKMNQVRAALAPISKLADDRNLAIVIVRHFTKDASGKSMMLRGGGSIDIPGVARSQLVLAKARIMDENGEEKDQRFLSREKCNWYKPVDSIFYDITGKPEFITWKDSVSKSGDDLTAPKDEDHKAKKSTEAQKLVLEALKRNRAGNDGEDEGMSLEAIASEVVKDKSNVRRTLAQLIDMDLVEKIGRGRYRVYQEE